MDRCRLCTGFASRRSRLLADSEAWGRAASRPFLSNNGYGVLSKLRQARVSALSSVAGGWSGTVTAASRGFCHLLPLDHGMRSPGSFDRNRMEWECLSIFIVPVVHQYDTISRVYR